MRGKVENSKPKTTTQRIYVEDWGFIKARFKERLEKPTAADAFRALVMEYRRLRELNRERKELIGKLSAELEEKDRLIELKNQKLYECLEANKALQKRIKELEENIEEWRTAYNQLADKLQKYEERIKELESQLENKGFWQRVKRFFGL